MALERFKRMGSLFSGRAPDSKEIISASHKAIPGLALEKTRHVIDLSRAEDMSNVDVLYPLIEPFCYASISWDRESRELVYRVIEPKLDREEREDLRRISLELAGIVDAEVYSFRKQKMAIEYLRTRLSKAVKRLRIKMDNNQFVKMMYYIYTDFLGLNLVEPLMQDPNVEDVTCDGVNSPIRISHMKFGPMRTDISFRNQEKLKEFVMKLAQLSGSHVSYAEPIMDGELPEGYRVSATIEGSEGLGGPSFTISKTARKPFSAVDQMILGTASPELLAYLWYLLEKGISIFVVGDAGTGRTSMLNTLSSFIPSDAHVVSVEDARELRLAQESWTPRLVREGFFIKTARGERYGEMSLLDVLRESYRMNADYVIVGDTRDDAMHVIFQAMGSGHLTLATFDAGSVDQTMERLTKHPVELPPGLVKSLDLIVVMSNSQLNGKTLRRVAEVAEVEGIDPLTKKLDVRTVFRWNSALDRHERPEESSKVRTVAEERGDSYEEALEEIERRRRILAWMKQTGLADFDAVSEVIRLYYENPQKLYERMEADLSDLVADLEKEKSQMAEQAKVENKVSEPMAHEDKETVPEREDSISAKKVRDVSLLDLLSMKLIRKN